MGCFQSSSTAWTNPGRKSRVVNRSVGQESSVYENKFMTRDMQYA